MKISLFNKNYETRFQRQVASILLFAKKGIGIAYGRNGVSRIGIRTQFFRILFGHNGTAKADVR